MNRVARHVLLMTATEHMCRERDSRLFTALLESHRFEGRVRDEVHAIDVQGLMRRRTKVDQLTSEVGAAPGRQPQERPHSNP